MISLATLMVSSATLAVAAVAAWFSWRSHRARLRSELPEIWMEPLDQGLYRSDQAMVVYFQLRTHHPNFGWRVVRVDVIEANLLRECLWHGATGRERWRDFKEFERPIEPGQYGELRVHPGCNDLVLRFLCERLRKRWWKKELIQEKKWIGPISTSWQLQTEWVPRIRRG